MQNAVYKDWLYKMLLIRAFEYFTKGLYTQKIVTGTMHLAIGQEAVAVGSIAALKQHDIVTASHRPNHIMLAKGLEPYKIFAEILGKATGYSAGLSGNMHLFAKDKGFWGSNGIVAANIGISTGIALAQKLSKKDKVVVTYFGEGAMAEGLFHESVNIASLWKLPIIYVCENNLYAQSTHISKELATKDIAEGVAKMYNIQTYKVDGMNIEEVYNTFVKIRQQISKKPQPVFVEAQTYRFNKHSVNEKISDYRTHNEISTWQERDPIKTFAQKLIKEFVITKEELAQLIQKAKNRIEEAFKKAYNDSDPKLEEVLKLWQKSPILMQ